MKNLNSVQIASYTSFSISEKEFYEIKNSSCVKEVNYMCDIEEGRDYILKAYDVVYESTELGSEGDIRHKQLVVMIKQ